MTSGAAFPSDFVARLEGISMADVLEMWVKKQFPLGGELIHLTNEVRPSDLFCYLGARFGPPNGLQNVLRGDTSDNIVYWQWTVRHPSGFVSFSGLNFRSEVHFHGNDTWNKIDKQALIEQIRSDLPRQGKAMSVVRARLEDWIEFVNPYARLVHAIEGLFVELDQLKLDPTTEKAVNPFDSEDVHAAISGWKEKAARYSKAFGLCFGIRSMLPVLAESFVNLLTFTLLRPEIRNDERLKENVFRQAIDIRVKSLAINCIGFHQAPDFLHSACKEYHTLVNQRNDLLHGNVAIDALKLNEVYFLGKVPVFKQYRTMWERSFEVDIEAMGFNRVRSEFEVVRAFITYLQTCIADPIRIQVKQITSTSHLGLNKERSRVGLLFSSTLVDFKLGPRDATAVGTSDEPQSKA